MKAKLFVIIHVKLIVITVLLLCSGRPGFADNPPNILYLYVDDMGWASIGPNGQAARQAAGQAYIKTPNIDSLASAGVNFQRAYACTVCSPSRSSQQTGFHQGHTWADRNDTDNAKKAMRADDITMGDMLKQAGYSTGYWGKWGYGGSVDQINPVLLNLQTLPNSHGYEDILAELHHVRAHTFFQPTLWTYMPGDPQISLTPNSMGAYTNPANYPQTPAHQNDSSYPTTAYCDDYYAMRALDFVRSKAQEYNSTGKPFFALLACQIPHAPFDDISQLPEWDEAYQSESFFSGLLEGSQEYAAMCTRIDAHIGNLLAALEDPDNNGDTSDSVANNTLVIFQSDNGGPEGGEHTAATELGATGSFRGAKTDVWEGGIRVPLIMRWPAKITATSQLQAGTNSDLVVDATNLLPTFCDLAGVEAPLGIDGVSLASLITGQGHQRTREFFVHEAQNKDDRAIIRGDYKLVDVDGDGVDLMLFNLATDPTESTDIAGSHPALVSELYTLLQGERVYEPQWSANTYHHWTGGNDDTTSSAANWSDYVYQNALNSIIYDTDSGAPRVTWVAKMTNAGTSDSTAVADANLEFLALEIAGASQTAKQLFDVNTKTITGRNEIRLSEYSRVELDNGTLNSLRWVDLKQDAEISGAGTVDATLYHAGDLRITAASGTTIPGSDIEIDVNGGFEFGTGTSFSLTDDWFNYGPDQNTNARNTVSPHSGAYRGIVGLGNSATGAIFPAVNTGYTIEQGDTFRLSFYYAAAGYWDIGSDTLKAILYYDDGSEHIIDSRTFNPSQDFNDGYDFTGILTFNATPGSVGHDLMLIFVSDTVATASVWASIDDVSLTREGDDIFIPGNRILAVTGNYRAQETALLDVTLAGQTSGDYAQLQIDGTAALNGTLAVTVDPGFTPAVGNQFVILTADSIAGGFANPNDVVIASDGTFFTIGYSATEVTLTAVSEYCDSGLYNSQHDVSGPEGQPDCKIDLFDLTELAMIWLATCDSGPYDSECDFSGPGGQPDCKIDFFDLAKLSESWLGCGWVPSTNCNL